MARTCMACVVSLCASRHIDSAQQGLRSPAALGRAGGNAMNPPGEISNQQAAGLVQRRRLQSVADFLVVGICTASLAIIVVGICAALLGNHAAGSRDFVEYWASGQLLAHHANPYDGDAILKIERSVGGYPSDLPPLIMWNPPPALLLVLPLGFVGSRAGELLWS